jgi:hypothetical protein
MGDDGHAGLGEAFVARKLTRAVECSRAGARKTLPIDMRVPLQIVADTDMALLADECAGRLVRIDR